MKTMIIYTKKTWLLLCLFFIAFSNSSYSQVDSLQRELKLVKEDTAKINLMLQIARTHFYTDINEAQIYTENALAIAENKNYNNKKDDAYDLLGIIYSIKGDYPQAIENYEKAIKINEALNNQIGLAKTYGNLSIAYQYQRNFEQAMEVQIKSLKISEQLGNKLETSISLHNLGIINFNRKEYKQSEDYYRRAINIGKELDMPNQMIRFLNNLGIVLYQQGNKDSAIYYVEQSLEISKTIDSKLAIAESVNLLGQFHFKNGNFEMAKKQHLQVLPIFEQSGDEYQLLTAYLVLAEDYAALSQTDSALYYLYKVLNLSTVSQQHLLDAYTDLAKLFIKTHQADSALFYLEKMLLLKDEMIAQEKTEVVERIQTEYETEKLKREKAEANEIILSTEKSQLWLFLICCLLLVGMVILVGFIKYRKTKMLQKQSELEQKALRSQMNPHFIFNSLNAIQDMYVGGETDLANNFMADFGELMRKILDNSGKSKISVKEEMDTLRLYLEMEKIRSGGLLSYHISIDASIDQLNTFLPPLVIQPFVENAVWHGILVKKEKGNVRVSLKKINEKLVCIIEDDGIGFENSMKNKSSVGHESKGMKLTEQRLGFPVKIEELNPGTRITLTISI